MAYGVTPDGFVLKPLQTINDEIDDAQRADVDPGLDLDARSAQGQFNKIFSGALAELWEVGQAAYSAAYPDSANDASLDNVASITGTTRDATTKTLVTGVFVTMNPNKVLPAGSVAHLASQPNARLVTLTEVAATAVGGVFSVDFEAESEGALSVAPGQLDTIAEPVSGWVGVTNPTAGVTGDATETDAELRIKRIAELEGGGSTNVNSIRANLIRDVDGVVDAAVAENDTDAVVAGLLPHSVRAVLRGGTAADIAQSLFDTKAGGIRTNGTEVESVLDSQGVAHEIRFDFATELVYYLIAIVEINPLTFDTTNGITNMKTAVETYVDSLPVGGDVVVDQVKCAILGVVGTVAVPTFTHGFAPAPTTPTDLAVAEDEFATSDVANLNVTTV